MELSYSLVMCEIVRQYSNLCVFCVFPHPAQALEIVWPSYNGKMMLHCIHRLYPIF